MNGRTYREDEIKYEEQVLDHSHSAPHRDLRMISATAATRERDRKRGGENKSEWSCARVRAYACALAQNETEPLEGATRQTRRFEFNWIQFNRRH